MKCIFTVVTCYISTFSNQRFQHETVLYIHILTLKLFITYKGFLNLLESFFAAEESYIF